MNYSIHVHVHVRHYNYVKWAKVHEIKEWQSRSVAVFYRKHTFVYNNDVWKCVCSVFAAVCNLFHQLTDMMCRRRQVSTMSTVGGVCIHHFSLYTHTHTQSTMMLHVHCICVGIAFLSPLPPHTQTHTHTDH